MNEEENLPHDPALVGVKAEKPAEFVKEVELAEAFHGESTETLKESREREIQLQNFIGQQAKLIEGLQKQIEDLSKEVRQGRTTTVNANEARMLAKTGVKREGDNLYADGPAVLPPSQWNIPSLEPVLTSGSQEAKGRIFHDSWNGDIPLRVRNPHRQQVRINDLKHDKDGEGLLIQPFEVVDLVGRGYEQDKISRSPGIRFCLQRGMLVAAGMEEPEGIPAVEPDSLQKRLSEAIGKVPRRGKVKRNPKTGKVEKEQGIADPALEAAATQHIQQFTAYDEALADQREYEESGQNIV